MSEGRWSCPGSSQKYSLSALSQGWVTLRPHDPHKFYMDAFKVARVQGTLCIGWAKKVDLCACHWIMGDLVPNDLDRVYTLKGLNLQYKTASVTSKWRSPMERGGTGVSGPIGSHVWQSIHSCVVHIGLLANPAADDVKLGEKKRYWKVYALAVDWSLLKITVTGKWKNLRFWKPRNVLVCYVIT